MERIQLIKILDTHWVNEIFRNWETLYLINKSLVKELEDIFNYDIVIIPIFKKEPKKCMLVIIEINLNKTEEDQIKVTLYDKQENWEGENSEGEFEDVSNLIHIIFQLVLGENSHEEYENMIVGDTEELEVENEWDMVPSVLQIAESKVLHEGRYPNESTEEYRHKILDRLVAFHLI